MSRRIVVLGAATVCLVFCGCVGSPDLMAVHKPFDIGVEVTIVYDAATESYRGSTISVDPPVADICVPAGNEAPEDVCDRAYEVNWTVSFVGAMKQCGTRGVLCKIDMSWKDDGMLNGKMYAARPLLNGVNRAGIPDVKAKYTNLSRSFRYTLTALDKDRKTIVQLDPDIMPHPPGG